MLFLVSKVSKGMSLSFWLCCNFLQCDVPNFFCKVCKAPILYGTMIKFGEVSYFQCAGFCVHCVDKLTTSDSDEICNG